MRYRIRTITALSAIPLPFTLAEGKEHLRVAASFTTDDLLITAQIRAAMDAVERFTSQVLTVRALELVLDGFPVLPELISIPREPVTAITSLKYSDASTGAEIVLASSTWRWSESTADTLAPAWSTSWPSAAVERGSVRLRFTAGYETNLAPASLIAAAKLMLGHLYSNREGVVTGTIATELPMAVRDLCMPYRRMVM